MGPRPSSISRILEACSGKASKTPALALLDNCGIPRELCRPGLCIAAGVETDELVVEPRPTGFWDISAVL